MNASGLTRACLSQIRLWVSLSLTAPHKCVHYLINGWRYTYTPVYMCVLVWIGWLGEPSSSPKPQEDAKAKGEGFEGEWGRRAQLGAIGLGAGFLSGTLHSIHGLAGLWDVDII